MNETLLKQQTQWQKKRKSLSWSEKIRIAEAVRMSALQLRRTAYPIKRKAVQHKGV